MAADGAGATGVADVLRGVQFALESRPKGHPWSLLREFGSEGGPDSEQVPVIGIETLHQLIYAVVEREEVDLTRSWYLHGPRVHEAPGSMVEYLRRFDGPLRQLQLTSFGGCSGEQTYSRGESEGPKRRGSPNHYTKACRRVLDEAPSLDEGDAFAAWVVEEHAPGDVRTLYEQHMRIRRGIEMLELWMDRLLDGTQTMRFVSGDSGPKPSAPGTRGAPRRLADDLELMYARLSTHPRLHQVWSREQYRRHVDRFENLEKIVRGSLGSVEPDFAGVDDQAAARRTARRLQEIFTDELWPPIGFLLSIDTATGSDAQDVIERGEESLSDLEIVRGEEDSFQRRVTELFRDLDRANLT